VLLNERPAISVTTPVAILWGEEPTINTRSTSKKNTEAHSFVLILYVDNSPCVVLQSRSRYETRVSEADYFAAARSVERTHPLLKLRLCLCHAPAIQSQRARLSRKLQIFNQFSRDSFACNRPVVTRRFVSRDEPGVLQ
jgi:hypothetical protein